MNYITILIFVVFLYPIIKGFILKFSSRSVKEDLQGINGDISFIIGFLIGIYYSKITFLEHKGVLYSIIYKNISKDIFKYFDNKPQLIFIIIMPICIFTIYKLMVIILDFICEKTIFPLFDGLDKNLSNKSEWIRRILGAIFSIPKALCYLIIIVFLLNFLSLFNMNKTFNKDLTNSPVYNYFCQELIIPITNSNLARQLPSIINNSLKVVEKKGSTNGINSSEVIVYYNGVTLDEAVKSNKNIDSFSKKLCLGKSITKDKAKILYDWVGENISYDNTKAEEVVNNDYSIKSGAIPTYETGKGICLDYSSLYIAMCRASNIKVRLITGEGFNGVSWVSHAWNQVYLVEENRWINVDTTFYKGGNYFDSRRFNLDHKLQDIAGTF
ncbi:MAG TPA: transglutaminase-like domain-containing protein [Clostridiaceae bacterium]